MGLYAYEKEHLKALRPYLAECAVLLKSNGAFPLAEAGEIALYGNGVRHTVKGGTGSGEVNSRLFINVETGMVRSGFRITTKEWLDAYDDMLEEARVQYIRQIKAEAAKAHTNAIMYGMGKVMPEPEYSIPLMGRGDVAVYVLSRISGEGNDRANGKGDLQLSDTEVKDILSLQTIYRKFMLVLNTGGPVDLTPVMNVENILVLSQLGVDTGLVLAKILLGQMNPSGKLTTTWAAAEDYAAVGDFGYPDDTSYKEGIYVGYRYFDSVGKKPLFPFGYGMSYTTFDLAGATVGLEGDTVSVTVRVSNTGTFSGKETVQVYVSVPEGGLDQPYQTLAGFAKTNTLAPGEEETVTVSFALPSIASYDAAKAAYVLEEGDYIVRVGTSSADTAPTAVLTLAETIIVKQVKNLLGDPGFKDWFPKKREDREELTNVPVLTVDPAATKTVTVAYDAAEEVDPLIAALTNEELAYLNVGGFDPNGGLLSVIGNASSKVIGAAGETTGMLEDKGIVSLVMADGPAGIRINRDYATDGVKNYAVGASVPESILEFMPGFMRKLTTLTNKKPPKGSEVKHQYCTAIPIGTAIAQSWNTAFAELCGDIVGEEMERFNVQLWLAPALNIHRSVLCGRNFEYYSEDPLISGKFAAAITKGVQKHSTCGTTIKHFAANNQETNRFQNNSLVSERAMREIYLRGFEICVAESQPHALMTSYNLLNGTHTSERRDLTQDILRSEFGHEGIVMTDWIVPMAENKKAKHGYPKAGNIAAAGGDLVMPGCKADYEDILKALAEGRVSRRQLEINGTRVYRMGQLLRK